MVFLEERFRYNTSTSKLEHPDPSRPPSSRSNKDDMSTYKNEFQTTWNKPEKSISTTALLIETKALEFLWIEFIPVFACLPAHFPQPIFPALELHTGGNPFAHRKTSLVDRWRPICNGRHSQTHKYLSSIIYLPVSLRPSLTETYIQLHTTCKAYQHMRALQIRQSW
jgi:hypothetical protein